MPDKLEKPNFFIIGVPRAATTTLYEVLKRHPNIFMSPEKETGFFLEKNIEDFSEYLKFFQKMKDEDIVGEATPTYLYSEDALNNIQDNMSEPKILIQLRDPVERVISQYRHNRREGQEKVGLSEALLKEEERIQKGAPKRYHYARLSFYSSSVKRCLEIFGEESVKITLFRDFSGDPTGLLGEIAEFLSVDPQKLPEAVGKHNVGNEPKFPLVNSFIQGNSMIKRLIQALIPVKIRKRWGNKIRQDYNVKNSKVEVDISKGEKRELRKKFKTDIENLEELINKDLSHWKGKNEQN